MNANIEILEKQAEAAQHELCSVALGFRALSRLSFAIDADAHPDIGPGLAVIGETLTNRLDKVISSLDAAVIDSRKLRRANTQAELTTTTA